MNTVLITGAGGQVGRELAFLRWPDGTRIVPVDRTALDITDPRMVDHLLDRIRPDVVVNAAAYTAVDRAEDEPDIADRVNHQAVRHLSRGADRLGYRLVHFSTDYVFDGSKDAWYVEHDEPQPLGVYGRSKLAGERAALASPRSLVLRTSWVYSRWGSNFVKTMLRLAADRTQISVVDDQIGCPTAAADIALAVRDLVDDHPDAHGLYHLASSTSATWWEFATTILAEPVSAGALEVTPITTADYPTRAARPANSRLDSSAVKRDLGIELPDWRQTLKLVLSELQLGDDHRADR